MFVSSGTDIVSTTPDGWLYDDAAVWNLGAWEGQTKTVTLCLRASQRGDMNGCAIISGEYRDENLSDNTACLEKYICDNANWMRVYEGINQDRYNGSLYSDGCYVSRPDLVDIDTDGDYDAVIGMDTKMLLYENIGSAKFAAWAAPVDLFTNENVTMGWSTAFCDMDADGIMIYFLGRVVRMRM